jgi:uncharacterized protein YqjF (DUF2071 family)
MNTLELPSVTRSPSSAAVQPLFIADWTGALFLHYEIAARDLEPFVPFELDLWKGRAFVSLVAFTMREMRLARLGAVGAWLCRPIATHEFLNLRTYVCHAGDPGICFLSEWLPNRLSLFCGPLLYSLPYRHAAIQYSRANNELHGTVTARLGCLRYQGSLLSGVFHECAGDSLDRFLLERYTAFSAGHFTPAQRNVPRRSFRVWHEPWLQVHADVRVLDDALLHTAAPCWKHARFSHANYSPGVRGVCMSAPRKVR